MLGALPSCTLDISHMSDHDPTIQDDVLIEDGTDIHEPRPYNVLLINDDYTPMDFVQKVLEVFFRHPPSRAAQLMLTVHKRGKAVAGTYTKEIAETKASQVMSLARSEGHPLQCDVEPA